MGLRCKFYSLPWILEQGKGKRTGEQVEIPLIAGSLLLSQPVILFDIKPVELRNQEWPVFWGGRCHALLWDTAPTRQPWQQQEQKARCNRHLLPKYPFHVFSKQRGGRVRFFFPRATTCHSRLSQQCLKMPCFRSLLLPQLWGAQCKWVSLDGTTNQRTEGTTDSIH